MSNQKAIFISYRRDDSLPSATSLAATIDLQLGEGVCFHDKSSLAPGSIWPDALRTGVIQAKVLLILICDADNWMGKQPSGAFRMSKKSDWVRQEIETALLDSTKLIIPVLIDNAKLPDEKLLPPSLRPVLKRQGFQIRNSHWKQDCGPLIEHIKAHTQIFPEKSEVHSPLLALALGKEVALDRALLLETDASRKFAYEVELKELRAKIQKLKEK